MSVIIIDILEEIVINNIDILITFRAEVKGSVVIYRERNYSIWDLRIGVLKEGLFKLNSEVRVRDNESGVEK